MLSEILITEDRRGKLTRTTKHEVLYHATNSHGFAYAIGSNSLRSRRDNYVSTSYDSSAPVVGRQNYHFKFVLDGESLARDYGVFDYRYDFMYTDGSSANAEYDEKEVGLNTKSVEPLREYLRGVILDFDITSRFGVGWLIRQNHEYTLRYFTGQEDKFGEAPTAIEAVITCVDEWGKDLWMKRVGEKPTQSQMRMLRDVYELGAAGKRVPDAIIHLADKYRIHDGLLGKDIDRKTAERMNLGDKLTDMFNDHFGDKKYSEMDPKETRKLVKRALRMLKLGANAEAVLMAAADSYDMFDEDVQAVNWATVFNYLYYGDIDSAIHFMEELQKKNASWKRIRHKMGDAIHSRTMFGSL